MKNLIFIFKEKYINKKTHHVVLFKFQHIELAIAIKVDQGAIAKLQLRLTKVHHLKKDLYYN